ncbi:hypothetical protein [Streptomyces sp. NPDC005898]|uniref:hypothetical protein n=1 Tax=Streptomyces sp. NPDC005898 TaxID=3157082 RepID=UPI0033F7B584
MVTHRKEFRVQTRVIVPSHELNNGGNEGVWGECPELPAVLGEVRIRSCDDLSVALDAHGGTVARLLRAVAQHKWFRLLARDRATEGLAGSVEWIRSPETGLWVQWDEPWTACAYGQHEPAATMLLAA